MEEINSEEFRTLLKTGFFRGKDHVNNRSGSSGGELKFSNFTVNSVADTVGVECYFKLDISNAVFNSYVFFEACTFHQTVYLTDVTFNERLSFIANEGEINNNKRPATFKSNLYFRRNIFENSIYFFGGNFENVFFIECIIKENSLLPVLSSMYIQGGNFNEYLVLKNCNCNNPVEFNGGTIANLKIFGGEYNSVIAYGGIILNFTIKNIKSKLILGRNTNRQYIKNLEIGEGLTSVYVNGFSDDEFERHVLIDTFTINYLPEKFFISDFVIIKEIKFNNFDSTLLMMASIINLKVSRIIFKNFNNYGKFVLNNIKKRSTLFKIDFINSNLGNFDLISCNFKECDIYIDSSKLINLSYTATTFPNNFRTNKEGKLSCLQLKDTYDQFQTVASRQGDRILSIDWQRKSLIYYFRSLTPFERKWWVLFLMLCSNRFRTSSFYGMIFTLIVGLFFFIPYCLAVDTSLIFGFPNCNTIKLSFNAFSEHIEYYWEFLNPTHKADFIKAVKSSGNIDRYEEVIPKSKAWAYFFDTLGRIFTGFGIYQTIQGFRRFGKGD